jgi:hypothetical protein
MEVCGPERSGQQGLGPEQEESGNRAILALLEDPAVRDHVDLVITCRDGAYEVWSARGLLRFRRVADGATMRFEDLEVLGRDPLANEDPTLLATLEAELSASGASEPERAFFEPEQVSHPWGRERIAALFDSPFAPDLVVSPRTYSFGIQPGQHGALDVVQSRAPLAFSGPGVRPGRVAAAVRHVDVAPTVARLMRFPEIDGSDALGRPARTWLRRQDGRALEEIVDPEGACPERVYMLLLDGLSHTELWHRLEHEPEALPNLRRILGPAAVFEYGSIVNFPSITWPSHACLLTGAWCGHHDIVNPAYYVRDEREVANPQGLTFETERFLAASVETLYEAFARVRGSFTAAINAPQGRGADHAPLERRVVGERARLRALTEEFAREISPRWVEDDQPHVQENAVVDARGLAQVAVLFDDAGHPAPEFVFHELALTDAAGHDYGPHSAGFRTALDETDVRIGHVLAILERADRLDGTLFVVTSDHGMAYQDTSLAANPARHLERIGMRAVTAEPMIWLRDLRVEIHRAADGRTARVEVSDADADRAGEHPAVRGVRVDVVDHPDRALASVTTDAHGLAAFTTPADIPSERIALALHHDAYNPRHLTLAGRSLAPDPRRLYE